MPRPRIDLDPPDRPAVPGRGGARRLTAAWLAFRAFRRLARPLVGRREGQVLFTAVHHFALDGLNVGGPADSPATSGERGVLNSLPAAPMIVDVGANVGDYARLALAIRPAARIVAFEPDPVAFGELDRIPGIDARNVALGSTAGRLELFRPEAGSPMASPYRRHHHSIRWNDVVRVPVTRLDDLDLGPVDLLKIDVEGHELAVIEGATASIAAGRVARIQFEFGGTAIDARIYLRDFFEALPGYRMHRVIQDGLVPIQYDERWEILMTTNFLAVKESLMPSPAG